MWNWTLYLLLTVLSGFAIFVAVPPQARMIIQFRSVDSNGGRALQQAVVSAMIQSLLIATIASAIGVSLAEQVGFYAPFWEKLANGKSPLSTLQTQVIPATVFGAAAAILLVTLYALVFRPRLGNEIAVVTEEMRLGMGLPARILAGGVFEEVVFRWGLMSLNAWLGTKIVGDTTTSVVWMSILIAALVFALAHIPGAGAIGLQPTPALVTMSLTLNVLAGSLFGWLFWTYGLLAAMIAHALFHVVWYPFEKRWVNKSR